VLVLRYSKERLQAFLEEVGHLKECDFPYDESKDALSLIEKTFKQHLERLGDLSAESHEGTVAQSCTAALGALFNYLPILGFILRSTNVRNAFEVYGPLRNLAQALLGSDTKLIISSEWDYSPYTIYRIPSLRNFVFIGLPAHESSNPLLIPLAGHELGHSYWDKHKLETRYMPTIRKKIIDSIKSDWKAYIKIFPGSNKEKIDKDLFETKKWEPALLWAQSQVQESFCDFFALRIFSESYLHAFSYLLAPGQPGKRSPKYPTTQRRVSDLLTAAGQFDIDVPNNYTGLFKDCDNPFEDQRQMKLLEYADEAAETAVRELIKKIEEIKNIFPACSPGDVTNILRSFSESMVPAGQAGTLANIVNAAWRAFHDADLWLNLPKSESKERILKELTLKTIEVLEYERLIGSEQ
jgi:hypothetical protein